MNNKHGERICTFSTGYGNIDVLRVNQLRVIILKQHEILFIYSIEQFEEREKEKTHKYFVQLPENKPFDFRLNVFNWLISWVMTAFMTNRPNITKVRAFENKY